MAPNRSYLNKDGEGFGNKALSLLFSMAFHTFVLAGLFFLSPLLKEKEKIPEIYTVKLFYPEIRHTPSPQRPRVEKRQASMPRPKEKKQEKKEIVEKKTMKKKMVASKNEKPPLKKKPKKHETVKTVKKKALTTRPEKPKKIREKKDEERILKERLVRIKRRIEEKKEEEYLRKRLAELKKKAAPPKGPSSHITSRAKGAGPQGENAILRQYFTRIWEIIRSRWVLPQGIIDRKDLEAVVALTISRDGKILVKRFEKKSNVLLFDQSVQRAMEGLRSLPPIPKELGVSSLDIGVRFRPED